MRKEQEKLVSVLGKLGFLSKNLKTYGGSFDCTPYYKYTGICRMLIKKKTILVVFLVLIPIFGTVQAQEENYNQEGDYYPSDEPDESVMSSQSTEKTVEDMVGDADRFIENIKRNYAFLKEMLKLYDECNDPVRSSCTATYVIIAAEILKLATEKQQALQEQASNNDSEHLEALISLIRDLEELATSIVAEAIDTISASEGSGAEDPFASTSEAETTTPETLEPSYSVPAPVLPSVYPSVYDTPFE